MTVITLSSFSPLFVSLSVHAPVAWRPKKLSKNRTGTSLIKFLDTKIKNLNKDKSER